MPTFQTYASLPKKPPNLEDIDMSNANNNYPVMVESQRQKIKAVKAQIKALASAPLPLVEAKQAADESLQRYVKGIQHPDSSARLMWFFRHSDDNSQQNHIDLNRNKVLEHAGTASTGTNRCEIDLGPILAWLFPDLVRQRLHDLLEEQSKTLESGPPMPERKEKLEKLEVELYELEEQEEAWIELAEIEDVEIIRRPDIDPFIVLGF
jgi:hypothetical protein